MDIADKKRCLYNVTQCTVKKKALPTRQNTKSNLFH